MSTLDSPGFPSPPELIDMAAGKGLALDDHRSRPLEPLRTADLVVGFELDHVAHAVVHAGADPTVTFTLPELARLLDQLPDEPRSDTLEDARDLVGAAHGLREQGHPTEGVTDPFGAGRKAYEQMVTDVTGLCDAVLARLFPASGTSAGLASTREVDRDGSAVGR